MKAREILNRYITFFERRGHKRIANAPLVLVNDPTTLFTSSGMQALLPYLLGEEHPSGRRLVNVQNCLRSQDIDEVGDNRHTTFFRMLGNWSLGDYFKREQLTWFFTFLTDKEVGLGLDPRKLYVTVFSGNKYIPKDTDSIAIWTKLFQEKNISAKFVELGSQENAYQIGMRGGRIFAYDETKNWWSRAGTPDKMPVGEPGGPDSEVFYDFGTPHDVSFGKECHPNCDCGRFLEIGNSVFMQYQKQADGSFKELPQKNVDFGGGLERLAAALNDNPDIFLTDLYKEIITKIADISNKSYEDKKYQPPMRIIADHIKATTFLIVDGVVPSNKAQGYILRRLLRRAAVKMYQIAGEQQITKLTEVASVVLRLEEGLDEKLSFEKHHDLTSTIIKEEIEKFSKTLKKGLQEFEKNINRLDEVAFDLYQTHGFPIELIEELAKEHHKTINRKKFDEALQKHRELSRTASAGMFRGGLADHSEKTIMGHTATHLLHQALRDVLGKHVHQTGSNITSERIRFDFNFDRKLTDEELRQVENIVNQKIKDNLPVHYELIPTEEAYKMGAIGLFMDTYGEKSKIYFIGDTSKSYKNAYSIEFCGGPHVEFTGVLKSFKIIKQENLGKNQKRIYAVVNNDQHNNNS
jgi:alanyl-tRNA synthetase